MDAAALESALRSFFAGAPPDVVAVYRYGSQARGTATPTSDVDIAVLHATEPPASLAGLPLALESDLERIIGAPVQVVVLDRTPVDLVDRVLRDGTLVFERDRNRRIAFEVKARNEFFDLKPILDEDRAVRAHRR